MKISILFSISSVQFNLRSEMVNPLAVASEFECIVKTECQCRISELYLTMKLAARKA